MRIRHFRNTLLPPQIGPCFYGSDFPYFPAMYKRDGVTKMLLTPLPLSNLHNTFVLILHGNKSVTLLNRVSQRFLYVNTFSSSHGLRSLQAMPMVGCSNDNGVNIRSGQQLFIIFIRLRMYISLFQFVKALTQHFVVNITDCGTCHIRNLQYRLEIAPSHPFYPYNAYPDPS